MAPNANTHLLTSRDYFRHPLHSDYCGVVLQLDLGDGATHTPRPGSRAQRANALAHTARHSQHAQGAMSCVRVRQEEDELRAAIELSVMRAYSSLESAGGGGGGGAGGGTWRSAQLPSVSTLSTLPHRHRPDLQVGARSSVPGVPQIASGSGVAGSMPVRELNTPPLHLTPRAGGQPAAESHSPTPSAGQSPRRHDYSLYARHDYRLEPTYGGSGSTSRGHSPNNYA